MATTVPESKVLPFRQISTRTSGRISMPGNIGLPLRSQSGSTQQSTGIDQLKNNKSIQEINRRLQRAEAHARQNSDLRAAQRMDLRKAISRSGWIVLGTILLFAGLADLMSIADLGWVISWTIPAISWVVVRRIKGIGSAADRISESTAMLWKQYQLLAQRLHPILTAKEHAGIVAQATTAAVQTKAVSYVRTFVRDTAIAQLVELIPGVDAVLPAYLAQAVKLIIDQNIAYQKAMRLMPEYENAARQIRILEQLEIQAYRRQAIQLIARLRQRQQQELFAA